jgi:hypothetical protein
MSQSVSGGGGISLNDINVLEYNISSGSVANGSGIRFSMIFDNTEVS